MPNEQLTLERSHIGQKLTVNDQPALVHELGGVVVALHRDKKIKRAIDIASSPLTESPQKINGVPRYSASVYFIYYTDPQYSSLDALLKAQRII